MSQDIEILSPAGDMECLKSAVLFGADAVYLAGKQFGMRTSSNNFSNKDLDEAICFAHEHSVKVYLCVNTLPRNNEIGLLIEFFKDPVMKKIDAFIVADIGVLSLIKKYLPDACIHISTQFGVTNYITAKELYNMGASRVVLARELSLFDISQIRDKVPKDLELEAFVHGSMCVSFSGRCLISSYMTGRDANRGDCAQPCRWRYHLYEENRNGEFFPIEQDSTGTYLFNSRDLCMIDYIPEIIKSGITSLKIEGRAKSSYYVSVVTNAYKTALTDYLANKENYNLKEWVRLELNKISHREYNTGFFFGNEPGQIYSNGGYIREYDVVATCEGFSNGFIEIRQRNKFLKGDILEVLEPGKEPFNITVESILDENRNENSSAPHAMQKLFIPCTRKVRTGSILRKKSYKRNK